MSIKLPLGCPKGRDCQPLARIMSDCKKTFVCCGVQERYADDKDGDIYTHCFRSVETDTEYQYNKTDLLDICTVLATSLAIGGRMGIEPENK